MNCRPPVLRRVDHRRQHNAGQHSHFVVIAALVEPPVHLRDVVGIEDAAIQQLSDQDCKEVVCHARTIPPTGQAAKTRQFTWQT